MITFFEALIDNPFLRTALFAGLLASFVSGIVGSYVVIKRIVFISGSIAHSVLGGIGFCIWLQKTQGIEAAEPVYGAIGAALLSAFIIAWIHLHYREREDAVIAALWSVGMAIGLLFISQTPGFNADLGNFLFGNLLWTSPSDLYILLTLDFIVLLLVVIFHKRLLLLCFDEAQAHMQGLNVNALYMLLLALAALSTVLLIHIVGIILVITMLSIPATIANLFTSRLSVMMFLAVLIGGLFSFAGTALAYHMNTPAGATIALFAGVCYLIALFFSSKRF